MSWGLRHIAWGIALPGMGTASSLFAFLAQASRMPSAAAGPMEKGNGA